MRATQQARRLIYRARRWFIGAADHEPLVEIVGQAGARPGRTRARLKRAAGRWLRSGAAFVATLAVLGVVYGGSVAWRERVSLPLDPVEAAGPASGSRAIAAAAGLLSLESIDAERAAWFAPSARKERLDAFQSGAAAAVAAFIEVIERRRAGRDKDLALAAAALSGAQQTTPALDYATARDALRRFNVRAGRKGPPVDRGQRAMAALARAAAAGAQAHDHALQVEGGKLHPGAITGAAREEFYRARGEAYAWRRLLAAYDEDLPPTVRAAAAPALAPALDGLAEAASFEPLFLAAPLAGDDNPLHTLAGRVAAATPALERLAALADAAPH